MLLLNFTHPITDGQAAQMEALTGQPIARIIESMPQFDDGQPLAEQGRVLVDGVGLSSQEWQTEALQVNPGGLT